MAGFALSSLRSRLRLHSFSFCPGSFAEAKAAGAATINYGVFLNVLSDFLIVAIVLFMLIRQVNSLKSEQETSAAAWSAPLLYRVTEWDVG